MIIYDSATIDSFSLSIPIEQVEIIDKNFISRTVTYYYDTEEYDEELQNSKPYIYSADGITLRFRILERLFGSKSQRLIVITISSKILKKRYFEGITTHNINVIFDFIISRNIFVCEFQTFLNGIVSDVDICTNYKISLEAFVNSNQKLQSFSLPGKNRFFNLFEKKTKGIYTNLGLDINTRQKAKPSHPYIKNYYKQIELTTKSLEFYDKFLKDELRKTNSTIKNLARIEYTIKGYKHKKRLLKKRLLKTDYKTLSDLLTLTPAEMKKIIYSGFKDYCEIPDLNNERNDLKRLSPTDALIVNLMEQNILRGAEKIDLFEVLNIYQGTSKSRLKNKIEKLYKHLTTNSLSLKNKLAINEEVNAFMNKLK